MKPLTAVLLVGGGIAAFSIIKRLSTSIESLSAEIKSYDLQGGTFWEPRIGVTLKIRNPSDQGYDIRSATGDAFFNNAPIGSFSTTTPLDLPKYSERLYPINVVINTSGIAAGLLELLKAKKGELLLKTILNVGGLPIHLNLPYRLI